MKAALEFLLGALETWKIFLLDVIGVCPYMRDK